MAIPVQSQDENYPVRVIESRYKLVVVINSTYPTLASIF